MEIYFNDQKCNNFIDLQNKYIQAKNNNVDKFKLRIEDDDQQELINGLFKIKKKEENVLVYLHKFFNEQLYENRFTGHRISELTDIIELVEDFYVKYCIETESNQELKLLTIHSDEYYNYPNQTDLMIMAEQCAKYDLENSLSMKSLDQLTDEYYSLEPQELIEEYEKIYSEDYMESLYKKINKSSDDKMIKKISQKGLSEYRHLKKSSKVNELELRRNKK